MGRRWQQAQRTSGFESGFTNVRAEKGRGGVREGVVVGEAGRWRREEAVSSFSFECSGARCHSNSHDTTLSMFFFFLSFAVASSAYPHFPLVISRVIE
jgi:hypothetical protein